MPLPSGDYACMFRRQSKHDGQASTLWQSGLFRITSSERSPLVVACVMATLLIVLTGIHAFETFRDLSNLANQ